MGNVGNSKSNDDKKQLSTDKPMTGRDEPEASDGSFFIAGLCASAGGLEAFDEFFKNLPPDTGMGFVIVSHLDPTKKDIMPDLIQRYTTMPVAHAENDIAVDPDHVYIIPPNKVMTIEKRALKLHELSAEKGVRMPIDTFLRSLADDRREMAIAIIFSGMGTDGMLGVKAIKEKNGTVMAQDPSEAKFDSMPQNAINTGMVDYVAPAYDLPEHLVEFKKNFQLLLNKRTTEKAWGASEVSNIMQMVLRKTGHDFSEYKMSTVHRRIERRMTVHQISELKGYIDYLKEHPDELDLLFKELLIGVTGFFRDSEAFDALEKEVIPEMLKDMPPDSLIRVWVPGCSTGEEAYSLAMVLLEALGDRPNKVQIFATDIDDEAIEFARKGVYPGNIAADVSEERLQKFFLREDGAYKIKKLIREMVVFAVQDVAHDPPFIGMDLISCRNLLIYMTQDMQNRIISLFAYALNPGGLLFLGSAETVGRVQEMFTTVNTKWKIFRRKDYSTRREVQTTIPVSTSSPMERIKIQAQGIRQRAGELFHQALMEAFSPPAAIIDHNGNIVYIHGHTGKYLEPAPGRATMNIVAMARKGLSTELGIAIEKAKREDTDVTLKNVDVQTNGHTQTVNVWVSPIRQPEAMKNFLMVAFHDVEKPPESKQIEAVAPENREEYFRLADELRYTKDKLQTTMEEMQASQEEMRSMNEELQSTNEELQSTNEELTTSKEELQSLNEELVTVNSELQAKVDDLTRANNDIKNLFNSTDIATIFLDSQLRIKRFTPSITDFVNLLPSDIGRPITDISTSFKDKDANEGLIVKMTQQVLDRLIPVEKMLETKDNRWYNMRILPYRTLDNIIDGVVVTFNDVTSIKHLEMEMRSSKEYSEAIVNTVREPLLVLDDNMCVMTANKAFFNTFHVSEKDTLNSNLFELGNKQWDIPNLRKLIEEVLREKNVFEDFKVEHKFPDIGRRVMLLNGRKIERGDKPALILLAIEDVTD